MRPAHLPTPVQEIREEIFDTFALKVFMKRDDLIHPEVSGNKWRKLKYNLKHACDIGVSQIISFGGAFSNHIHALGYACRDLKLPLTIFVRGERTLPLNPTLADLTSLGVNIRYLSREKYRERNSEVFLRSLEKDFPDSMIIPEGGSNQLALTGVGEMIAELKQQYDDILLPVGTGGTLAGCSVAAPSGTNITGFVVLKGADGIAADINRLTTRKNYALCHDYHFGGYAKYTPELVEFMNTFKAQHGISLDPVYTGKMIFGFYQRVAKGFYRNKRILLIHTGGLQGVRGFNQRFNNLLD